MKLSLDRFTLRYLSAVLLGRALLPLHGAVDGGPLAVLVPQCASAWELSKLAYWPMLLACAVTGRLGGERKLCRDLPGVVLTPLTLTAADWAVLSFGGKGRTCLMLWAAFLAAGLAFGPDGTERRRLWTALTAALAAAYGLLTYFPPRWGLFLDPAAMGVVLF